MTDGNTAALRVEVCYFASARDAAGCGAEEVTLEPGATVGDLRALIGRDRQRLAGILPTCRVAVGDDFADDTTVLRPGDEVFVLPPVSGGSPEPVEQDADRKAAVVDRDIVIGETARLLNTDGAGGIAVFTGVARNHSQGRQVLYLDFEAHVPLAEKELGRILAEATEKFALVDARVLHRIGHVGLGEVAVDIAVASAHRAEAFTACRYVIDELKQRAPIWKKETDVDGTDWVTPTP